MGQEGEVTVDTITTPTDVYRDSIVLVWSSAMGSIDQGGGMLYLHVVGRGRWVRLQEAKAIAQAGLQSGCRPIKEEGPVAGGSCTSIDDGDSCSMGVSTT